MTEVTFYLSSKVGDAVRQALAWRIADKAMRQERRIYVHCDDAAHAAAVDTAFWDQPTTGFLPHDLAEAQTGAPVVIGHGDDPGDHHDVMINLTDEVPEFASRFQRIAELISGEQNVKESGRARFRFYRDRGFPVRTHQLG